MTSRVLLFLMISSMVVVLGVQARSYGSECETLASTIHVTKEHFDEVGRMIRCEDDLAVNKCEGACSSRVQPSVNTASGFLKDCKCCRETHLRTREFQLTQCRDVDGNLIPGEKGQLVVQVQEPAGCKCSKCGDTTR
ncbi:bursicon subunit partner of burs [Oratosquilla oratoria]|uniref:bursicon subunit partner of burs n=1 Tax=Oratosquilla oratoria TaxID=337810 RepID=UPI003F762449